MDVNESSSNENNDGTNRHGKSKSYWGLSTAAHAVHGVGYVAKKVVNNRFTDTLWHSKKTGSSDKRENHSHETVDQHAGQPSLDVADEPSVSSEPTQEKESVGIVGSDIKPQDGSHDGNVVDRLQNTKATNVSHLKQVNQHRRPSSSQYGSSTVWPSTSGSNAVDHSNNPKPQSSSHGRQVNQHRWPSATSSNVLSKSINHVYEASRAPGPKRKIFQNYAGKALPEPSSDSTNAPSSSSATAATTSSSLVDDDRLKIDNPKHMSLASRVKHSSIVRGTGLTPATRSASDSTTTRGASPSPATIEADPSSQKSGPLDKENGLMPTIGRSQVSPTPSRQVSPTASRGASPTPDTTAGPCASDASVAPVKSSKSSSRRHFFSANILSVFTKIVDNRKEKNAESPKEVAHHLELLYNIQVQWQFANASAEAALARQKATAEKSLFDVWRVVLELRDSLASKKIDISLIILQLKLYAVLYKQMAYIDEWAAIQKEHETALFATTSDLQARSLSVPLIGGITADIKGLKLILFSTVQVLQATISCIQSTLSKLDKTHFLASELANLVLHERALLDECEIFLASAAPLHMEECSLRSYLLQSNRTSMTE